MIEWFIALIGSMGLLGLLLVSIAVVTVPVLPAEIAMATIGINVAENKFTLPEAIMAALAGAVIGNVLLYASARLVKTRFIETFVRRYGKYAHISESSLTKARKRFDKFSPQVGAIGQLIPGVRFVVMVAAGLENIQKLSFVLSSLGGIALWVIGYMLLGYYSESSLDIIGEYLELVVWSIAGAAFVAYIARRYYHRS